MLQPVKRPYTLKGDRPITQLLLGAALVGTGIIIGAQSSNSYIGTANAQFAPLSGLSGKEGFLTRDS